MLACLVAGAERKMEIYSTGKPFFKDSSLTFLLGNETYNLL